MKINSPIPRVAAIHDLSGYGRASLTVVIPILSVMGVQVCPLPTAILSSQTSGVEDFSFFDLTAQMEDMLAHWGKIGLRFDAVYSGFLGSVKQASLVSRCMDDHGDAESFFLVDPVLGDGGALYATQTQAMVESMKLLVSKADIVCPNFTELCLLLDVPYDETVGNATLKRYMQQLADMKTGKNAKTVLVTSAPSEDARLVRVVCYEEESGKFWQSSTPRVDAFYPGTGDAFASVFLGAIMQRDSVPMAVARAATFVYDSIMATYGYNGHFTDGIMLECVLPLLLEKVNCEYRDF